jgi:hypothetical protein
VQEGHRTVMHKHAATRLSARRSVHKDAPLANWVVFSDFIIQKRRQHEQAYDCCGPYGPDGPGQRTGETMSVCDYILLWKTFMQHMTPSFVDALHKGRLQTPCPLPCGL